jgi:hypothetical protein
MCKSLSYWNSSISTVLKDLPSNFKIAGTHLSFQLLFYLCNLAM